MSNFLPFYKQSGSNMYSDLNNNIKKPNTFLNILLFLILFFIVIFYFYFMIYKKYKNFKKKSENISISKSKLLENEETEEKIIDPSVLNTQFIDGNEFNFEIECSEISCPQLTCKNNEIILRKRNQCCPECINIGGEQVNSNIDYQKRLEQLNQFVNKNISDFKFNTNFNDIGRNTTKVTFSLIDRLSEFNYNNFNLEEFIKIFNKESEFIYIGIIFFIIGLFFIIFSK